MDNEELARQISLIVLFLKQASSSDDSYTESDWNDFAWDLFRATRINKLDDVLSLVLEEDTKYTRPVRQVRRRNVYTPRA